MLVIGTANRLLLWDGEQKSLMESGNLTYGISWSDDEMYVVNGSNVLFMDWRFRVKRVLDAGLWGPHQALWVNGTLFIMESARNCIVEIDTESLEVTRYPWPFLKEGKDPHINSIWVYDQRFWIVEHNQQNLPKRIMVLSRGWKLEDVIEIDGAALMDRVSGIHNVYVEDDILYTLGPGVIVRCDLSDRTFTTVVPEGPFKLYLRGLAKTEDYFYIGVSHYTSRERRDRGSSAILVMDGDLNQLDLIELQDTGQLCEIRALAGDRAHNGIDWRTE